MGEEETVTADDVLNIDNLEINLATYQVTLDNEPIDLTLMEYSLLSFLATHPNRAYSREVLLHRVWGFEYCGGTRTVDVHIRRLRAKLGGEYEHLIGTVRNVGYRFDPPEARETSHSRLRRLPTTLTPTPSKTGASCHANPNGHASGGCTRSTHCSSRRSRTRNAPWISLLPCNC